MSSTFETRKPSRPGWYTRFSDGTFQGPHPNGETGARKAAKDLSMPGHPVTVVQILGKSKKTLAARRSKSPLVKAAFFSESKWESIKKKLKSLSKKK